MDLDQIHALIRQGESSTLELKSTTGQLKAVFETVCAFLNSKGGTVLIGVKNNGQLVGQDVTDNTRQEMACGMKKIEPPEQNRIEIYYIPLNQNKYVIALVVQVGMHAPYTYNGRAYARIESSTSTMPQHLYEQLLVRRGQLNHKWEEQISEGYDIASLDYEEIRFMIKEGVDNHRVSVEVLNYDIEKILSNLKLMKDGRLINAAVILFAKEVEPHYSHCVIKMARFRGTDKLNDFIDNQRAYGNAFHLIYSASDFVTRHLPIASSFESGKLKRIDQPAVPPLALREALINAIIHRDYSVRSASIFLAIYDDRLKFGIMVYCRHN